MIQVMVSKDIISEWTCCCVFVNSQNLNCRYFKQLCTVL